MKKIIEFDSAGLPYSTHSATYTAAILAQYEAIGTPEEIEAELAAYRALGTVEEIKKRLDNSVQPPSIIKCLHYGRTLYQVTFKQNGGFIVTEGYGDEQAATARLKELGGKSRMRMKPYTQIGIKRKKCFRCGAQAETQWEVCADGNQYRPLCKKCDVELNRLVLNFMKFPNADELIKNYEGKMK